MKDDDLVSLHSDKRWQNAIDRIRLNRLEKGWQGPDEVGERGSMAIFLVIPLEDYARYFGTDYHLPSPPSSH